MGGCSFGGADRASPLSCESVFTLLLLWCCGVACAPAVLLPGYLPSIYRASECDRVAPLGASPWCIPCLWRYAEFRACGNAVNAREKTCRPITVGQVSLPCADRFMLRNGAALALRFGAERCMCCAYSRHSMEHGNLPISTEGRSASICFDSREACR